MNLSFCFRVERKERARLKNVKFTGKNSTNTDRQVPVLLRINLIWFPYQYLRVCILHDIDVRHNG